MGQRGGTGTGGLQQVVHLRDKGSSNIRLNTDLIVIDQSGKYN